VLELSDGAREYLAAARYDPQYGARPLKWAIRKELETSLSKLLLKGEVGDGQTVVVRRGCSGRDYFPSEIGRRVAAANFPEEQFNFRAAIASIPMTATRKCPLALKILALADLDRSLIRIKF
jgi:hypothetical protein